MTLYNWERIPYKYKYAAMDKDGSLYAFTEKPDINNRFDDWHDITRNAEFLCTIHDYINFPNWKDSLEHRPEWSK